MSSPLDDDRQFGPAAAGGVAIWFGIWAVVFWQLAPLIGPDFGAYYAAAERLLDGSPLYETGSTGVSEYVATEAVPDWVYPPVYALVVVPFTILPYRIATFVWAYACSFIFLWTALVWLARELGYRPSAVRLAIGGVLLLVYPPIGIALKLGQVTVAIVATLTAATAVAVRAKRRKARLLSGALTGVAVLVKPFYAPAATDILHDRRRFIGCAVGCGAVLAASLAFGPETVTGYLDVIADGKGWGDRPLFGGPPAGWYEPLFILGPLATPARVLIAAATTVAVWVGRTGGSEASYGATALGFAAVPLVAPEGQALELVLFVPAALLVGAGRDRLWPLAVVLALAALQPLHLRIVASVLGGTLAPDGVLSANRTLVLVSQPGLWANLALWGLAAEGTLRPGETNGRRPDGTGGHPPASERSGGGRQSIEEESNAPKRTGGKGAE